jgi:hypothetical protein
MIENRAPVRNMPLVQLSVRIVVGTLAFLDVTLLVLKHGFARLEWVSPLLFGLFVVFGVGRQRGEGFVAWLRRPRALFTVMIGLIGVVWGALGICGLFAK